MLVCLLLVPFAAPGAFPRNPRCRVLHAAYSEWTDHLWFYQLGTTGVTAEQVVLRARTTLNAGTLAQQERHSAERAVCTYVNA